MIKLRTKRFCMRFGCGGIGSGSSDSGKKACDNGSGNINSETKWEVRPGGMLVQKRDDNNGGEACLITVRVSTVSRFWRDISIDATSTFGELKMILSLVTGLEPREQRLLFKGKERDDKEFLHMVGVRDSDKVLLLEDPAIKEMKLHGIAGANQPISV